MHCNAERSRGQSSVFKADSSFLKPRSFLAEGDGYYHMPAELKRVGKPLLRAQIVDK